MERQRREVEKLQKIIEEEEIKMLRKEMIPKAQLMPFFDRPFFPQRSTRPLTVPKEPSFMSSKYWRSNSCNDPRYFQQFANASRKFIK
ncbi:hypothetical protein Scep_016236 [Stephania cephalantha]|uniref:TPX2 C-terminal domain-containing protein n=1 Tax=Stephania cephalantha TaxID=152367 RepID=A0AAP0INF1_9MAGN